MGKKQRSYILSVKLHKTSILEVYYRSQNNILQETSHCHDTLAPCLSTCKGKILKPFFFFNTPSLFLCFYRDIVTFNVFDKPVCKKKKKQKTYLRLPFYALLRTYSKGDYKTVKIHTFQLLHMNMCIKKNMATWSLMYWIYNQFLHIPLEHTQND